MNNLFNSALRQSNSIQKDLAALREGNGTLTAGAQGQLNASLTSFARTIEEYNQLAKQEIVDSKKEKALGRVKDFREKLADYREQFNQLKKQNEEQSEQSRNELFGRRPHHASTPENPYNNTTSSYAKSTYSNAPISSPFGAPPTEASREDHALREQNFMTQANAQLDEFLDRGRAVLGDLGQQKEMLKGTQKRLYSVANTLGVSGDTIRMVERRARQDKWIFWGGVVGFFGFCWLVVHFLT